MYCIVQITRYNYIEVCWKSIRFEGLGPRIILYVITVMDYVDSLIWKDKNMWIDRQNLYDIVKDLNY